MEFIVVTGMSGSGKTCASNVLEDMGYYCIDNLPSAILSVFADIYSKTPGHNERVAFVADVRGESDFGMMRNEIEKLKTSGWNVKTIFFDCDDKVLINRYKETRRSHPLVMLRGVLTNDALKIEREMLNPIKETADYKIDTTSLTVSQLRDELMAILNKNATSSLVITCLSFGYKYGLPTESDLVFDVRCFPNPFYIESLKNLTGLDAPVRDYVFSNEKAVNFFSKLEDMIDYLVPLYANEGKSQLTIAIGCTGGKHRSVAMTEALSSHLKEYGCNVLTVHRDIIKKFIGDK